MELRFKEKIDQYLQLKITIKQNGFVKGGRTSIKICTKKLKLAQVIDFSQKLYQILRDKNIMEKKIHFQKLNIRETRDREKQNVLFKDGYLWDHLYLLVYLIFIKKYFWNKYADHLCVTIKNKYIQLLSVMWILIQNNAKCGFINLKQQLDNNKYIERTPIVDEYLGINMNIQGNLKNQRIN